MSNLEKDLLDKIKQDIDENNILSKLVNEYDIYPLLEFNELNIKEKIQNNAYYAEQFQMLRIKELQRLKILENMLDRRMAEVYNKYKEENVKLSKVEIEKYYIPLDKKVQEIQEAIFKQELIFGFFDACYEAFKRQGWSMNQFIKSGIGGM